ncbi:MAG: hypothetical protein K8S54_20805 [Spirochaetia bacterium]|nr:hypothetical protein [Spirochaetia bacterium]
MVFPPGNAHAQQFYFAGINFLDGSSPGIPDLSKIQSGISRPAWPALDDSNSICMRSHTQFFYDREAGLKFQFCEEASASEKQAIAELLSTETNAPSQPVIHLRNLSLEIGSIAPFKRDPFLVSIDSNQILNKANVRGERQFKIGVGSAELPARFLHAEPALLISEQSVIAIYPFSGSDFLILTWTDAALSNQVLNAILPIEIHNKELKNTGAANPYVSEIRFATAGDSYVEISSNVTGSATFTLHGSSDLPIEAFFFQGGAYIPNFKPGTGFTFESGYQSRIFRKEESLAAGASDWRSWSADAPGSTDELKPSLYCGVEFCGTPGIAPAALPETPRREGSCTTSDLQLTEWNPFGVMRSGSLDSGGKFVELLALRSCISDALVVLAGTSLRLPRELKAGETLLFAAEPDLFEKRAIAASLRSLSPLTSIQIFDLQTGDSRALFEGSSSEDRWIFASQNEAGEIIQVHSLTLSNGPVFHEAILLGLRPDLGLHAMSPGYQTYPGTQESSARLSELYPTGSYNGTSISGDEFFEIQSNAAGGRGKLSLAVKRLSDGKTILHLLPLPSRQYTAVFTANPQCFPGIHTRSDLFLPNEAAEYTLSDGSRILDSIQINSQLYSQIESSRRSIGLHNRSNRFVQTSGGTGTCMRSIASPGEANSFDPFAIEEPASGASRRFRIYLSSNSLLRTYIGADQSTLQEQTVHVQDGDVVSVADSTRERSVFRLFVGETVLAAGEVFRSNPGIFIETVAPSPVAGEEEWIRVCSRDGFSTDSLRIKDESSEDTIVPFSVRTGLMIAPYGTDLNLSALSCAIIVDPDYRGHAIPPPAFPYVDRALWTIASTSAIGNGLASGETLRIYRLTSFGDETLATAGLPDIAPFHITTSTGQRMVRNPDSPFDQIDAWSIK